MSEETATGTETETETPSQTETPKEQTVTIPDEVKAQLAQLDSLRAAQKQAAEELETLRKFKTEAEKASMGAEERTKAELTEAQKKAEDAIATADRYRRRMSLSYANMELERMDAINTKIVSLLPPEALELDEDQRGLSANARKALKQFAKDNQEFFKQDVDSGLPPATGTTPRTTPNNKSFFGELRAIHARKTGR